MHPNSCSPGQRPRRSLSSSISSLLLLTLALFALALPHGVSSQAAAQNRKMGSEAIVPLRTHSISAPYVDSTLQNKFWDFGGDTIVDTASHIRLTQDRPGERGWLWSRSPLTPDSYEIIVEFNIDGKHNEVHGDGFAMWLTHERKAEGPVFGSKDKWHGMGIFFDTFPNAHHSFSHPRASIFMNDGDKTYDLITDGVKGAWGGCSADFRGSYIATKARFTHVKGVYTELELHWKDWDHWESCFRLDNVTMPANPYLGFTALTGDAYDNHDIVAVQTSNIVFRTRTPAELRAAQEAIFKPVDALKKHDVKADKKAEKAKDHAYDGYNEAHEHSGGGFFSGFFGLLFTLIKWALVLGAIGGAVLVGLTWQRKRDAKRF